MTDRALKLLTLKLATAAGWATSLVPTSAKVAFVKFIILVFSRVGKKRSVLKFTFEVIDFAVLVLNERALHFNNGIHPKHELMNYADFFSKSINPNDKVLDIGCGYGEVARRVTRTTGASVIGVDTDREKIRQACKDINSHVSLRFIHCDHEDLTDTDFDVVILSNVLEHIANRVTFLSSIRTKFSPRMLLVRVPDYERNWEVAYRESEGFNHYSDSDHKIEHTEDVLVSELKDAGFSVIYLEHRWGELWVRARCS